MSHILSYDQICNMIVIYFERVEYRRIILNKWNVITFASIMRKVENENKFLNDCFQLFIQNLRHLQHELTMNLQNDNFFHNKFITACRNVLVCKFACYKSFDTVVGLINDIRSFILTFNKIHQIEIFFTDRRFHEGKRFHDNNRTFRFRYQFRYQSRPQSRYDRYDKIKKICFVCKKEGCWSINHSQKERDVQRNRVKNSFRKKYNDSEAERHIRTYIADYESTNSALEIESNEIMNIEKKIEILMIDFESAENFESKKIEKISFIFLTDFEVMNESEIIITDLINRFFSHRFDLHFQPKIVFFIKKNINRAWTFVSIERYTEKKFFGIMIDTEISRYSTIDYEQFLAYSKIIETVINSAKAEIIHVQFDIKSISFIKSIIITISIDQIEFHVIKIDTFFLLCLADFDRLGVYYNNINDILVQKGSIIFVIRRFGHLFLLWNSVLQNCIIEFFSCNLCFLIEVELRRLHKRFEHFSVKKLENLLKRSNHEVDRSALKQLIKFCDSCQKHIKISERFRFILRKNVNFNHSIIVDIMFIEESSVLHIIDEDIRYQIVRWLKNMSVKHVWNMLRLCWIDVYLRFLDYIHHDADKNFMSREFRQYCSIMSIVIKAVFVEAHWSIEIIERYHSVFRRTYLMIMKDLIVSDMDMTFTNIIREIEFQMIVKIVNDIINDNGLIFTLLVFGAYFRMQKLDFSSSIITQRVDAIRKTMKKIRIVRAEKQISDALNIRNESITDHLHDLSLNSEVFVWRKDQSNRSNKWIESFNLLGMENEICKIDMFYDFIEFRSTVVKSYYRVNIENNENNGDTAVVSDDEQMLSDEKEFSNDQKKTIDQFSKFQDTGASAIDFDAIDFDAADFGAVILGADASNATAPNASNQTKSEEIFQSSSIKRPRGRFRKQSIIQLKDQSNLSIFLLNEVDSSASSPRISYAKSRRKEIDKLLNKKIFDVLFLIEVFSEIKLFNFRFVDEIKNLEISVAFKKFRLMVQTFNDQKKKMIMTQSFTIQRMNQRLILILAAIIGHELYFRDIFQAYVQSVISLIKEFYIRPSTELELKIDHVFKMIKSLYEVPETGAHWYNIYHNHHTKQLAMHQSIYDFCLLHINVIFGGKGFGVIDFQIDDTLILADEHFAEVEEIELHRIKLLVKFRKQLIIIISIKFNGGYLKQQNNSIFFNQKRLCQFFRSVKPQSIDLINTRGVIKKLTTLKNQYIVQRIRRAYIVFLFQSKISFDFSFVVQTINFKKKNARILNRRLQWQIDNYVRKLQFVQLNRESLKLIIFIDESFANNFDLIFQIDYVICLTDATNKTNIIHWFSVKCKRVIRSILISELYVMIHDFDADAVIKSIVKKILTISILFMIVCIDFKSLYECLIRLKIIQKKRFMINIMCLRKVYERREIIEIRWIDEKSNSADVMTKENFCDALKRFISTNIISARASG